MANRVNYNPYHSRELPPSLYKRESVTDRKTDSVAQDSLRLSTSADEWYYDQPIANDRAILEDFTATTEREELDLSTVDLASFDNPFDIKENFPVRPNSPSAILRLKKELQQEKQNIETLLKETLSEYRRTSYRFLLEQHKSLGQELEEVETKIKELSFNQNYPCLDLSVVDREQFDAPLIEIEDIEIDDSALSERVLSQQDHRPLEMKKWDIENVITQTLSLYHRTGERQYLNQYQALNQELKEIKAELKTRQKAPIKKRQKVSTPLVRREAPVRKGSSKVQVTRSATPKASAPKMRANTPLKNRKVTPLVTEQPAKRLASKIPMGLASKIPTGIKRPHAHYPARKIYK